MRCRFAQVEATNPSCPLYPGPLKPTDELIAIDGSLIVDPTAAAWAKVTARLATGTRPTNLTFVARQRPEHRVLIRCVWST